MKERYSSGFYGELFLVSTEQRLLFPHADLAREENLMDRFWFARLFYAHKIASLLFPDNFIEVVGSQNKFVRDDNPPQFKMTLLSKTAEVNPDHATFSDHVVTGAKFGMLRKVQICKCGACIRHRKFHRDNNLKAKAGVEEIKMEKVGIRVPQDKTDYCLGQNGIVFFEMDGFDRKTLRRYLEGLASPNEHAALRLLDRYDQSLKDSKRIAFSVGGVIIG